MSQHVFYNFVRLLLYIIIVYCVLLIKLNKLSRDNDDIIYYYCGYSAEEVILRNNFESISAIICLRPKCQYNNNKQKLNKNLAFGELFNVVTCKCIRWGLCARTEVHENGELFRGGTRVA